MASCLLTPAPIIMSSKGSQTAICCPSSLLKEIVSSKKSTAGFTSLASFSNRASNTLDFFAKKFTFWVECDFDKLALVACLMEL